MIHLIRRGLGDIKPYEPGRPIELVEKELGITEAIKLASNESPYGPFPQVIEAMEESLRNVNRYPDSGSTFLKEKIADKLGVPASMVVIGQGSNELLRLLANVLLNPGDEVVMATPSFIVYPTVVKMMHAKCLEVLLKDHRHDLDAMADAITGKTKIVFICNPNNPTATIVTKDEVNRFMGRIPENVVVVFDEAYFELVEDENYPNGMDYMNGKSPVVVLRTFSKVHGLAGLRIGYGIAPEFLVKAIDKVREPFNVTSVAQAGAIQSLNCTAEIEERSRLNSEGLSYLCKEFDKLGIKYIPSHANFVLVDIGMNDREASNMLMKKGVIVRSGDIFGYPNWLRVTVGTPAENTRFVEELRIILAQYTFSV